MVLEGAPERPLDGRYKLLERLGSGGMAVVWRARDEVLGREVAVKVLAADRQTDEPARARIRAEAKAVAKLSHPNVASVHDYGEAPDDEGLLQPYVVMELVNGETLAVRMRSGPMPWRDATAACAEVAAGLAAAHARGIVHRDIKPANIMLTAAGVKVVDFGLAGFAGSPGDMNAEGVVYGTPAFLAPERLLDHEVNAATDVYALGLLLYLCLTHHLPWDADTPTQMIRNHQYVSPNPLPPVKGLPASVADLCGRCLEKDPAARPTAAEAARALAAAAKIGVQVPPGARIPAQRRPSDQAGHRPPAKRRSPVVLGTIGAVAAVGVAAAVLLVVQFTRAGDNDPVSPVAAASQAPCRASVVMRRGGVGNRPFGAKIVLNNRRRVALPDWRLTFTFHGGEHLVSADGATWRQDGPTVTLTGTTPIGPGEEVTLSVNGVDGNHAFGPPDGFTLNGDPCEAEIGHADGPGRPPGGPPPPDGGPPPPRPSS